MSETTKETTSAALVCDGACRRDGECSGEVKRVEVFDCLDHSWGIFNYCQTAIDCDRKSLFRVKVLSPSKP